MPSSSLIEKSCLIGNPVAGNPTHYMIEQAIRQADSDWRFLTFEVAPEDLEDAIRGVRALGFRGVKVAEPFRESVVPLLDSLTERATLAGSVNCLLLKEGKLIGDTTVGSAVVDSVHAIMSTWIRDAAVAANGGEAEFSPDQVPPPESPVILGAGRAARSVASALALAGVQSLTVVARDAAEFEKLAKPIRDELGTQVAHRFWGEDLVELTDETELLVNASSICEQDPEATLPIDPNSFPDQLIVADMSFLTPARWLPAETCERSLRRIEGLDILVEQTAQALRAWSHIDCDRSAMRDAAEEFLAL